MMGVLRIALFFKPGHGGVGAGGVLCGTDTTDLFFAEGETATGFNGSGGVWLAVSSRTRGVAGEEIFAWLMFSGPLERITTMETSAIIVTATAIRFLGVISFLRSVLSK